MRTDARVLLWLISAYQRAVSPYLRGACRYYPSCSEYMSQAVAKYGAKRGLLLGLRRICRCHPFGGRGYDPVP
ncbi:MAG: membrane protein insertion efficiency factor YidD [Firmicutes bacterium]|nr:membrane protein insertion efficiency factor YidD [Bacillota bacterium]